MKNGKGEDSKFSTQRENEQIEGRVKEVGEASHDDGTSVTGI
jgi:hypothetical protein